MVSFIMDVSPVRSSAKCGSDFSIERILSSEPGGNRAQSAEAPSWLCCTRYQPPRLPRASTGNRARRSGRHARVPFTAAQAAALEAAYARAPYLAPPALRALAAALQLRDDRIKIWFQNRRARERREKSTSIAPLREMPLVSTSHFRTQEVTLNSPPGFLWGHARTEVNTPSHDMDNFRMSTAGRLYESIDECPKDLSVATSSESIDDPGTKTERPGYERAETPLDVESIED